MIRMGIIRVGVGRDQDEGALSESSMCVFRGSFLSRTWCIARSTHSVQFRILQNSHEIRKFPLGLSGYVLLMCRLIATD